MSEANDFLDQSTVDFITKFFQDLLTGFAARTEDRIQQLEDSVEAIEKQIANLVLGYGEQAVFMEALVAQMAFATDDARKAFHEDLAQARKNMLEVMQNASKGILADEDQKLASAITDLASSKLSDTNS